MRCPRDSSEMQYEGFWKYPRHSCATCGGVLLSERDAAETAGQGGKTFAAAAGADKLPEGELRCPRDSCLLRVLNHRGVQVDVCPACKAVWLDRGELEKVMARASQAAEAAQPTGEFQLSQKPPATSPSQDAKSALDIALDVLGIFSRSARVTRRVLKRTGHL